MYSKKYHLFNAKKSNILRRRPLNCGFLYLIISSIFSSPADKRKAKTQVHAKYKLYFNPYNTPANGISAHCHHSKSVNAFIFSTLKYYSVLTFCSVTCYFIESC